jgi:hypothetical protein
MFSRCKIILRVKKEKIPIHPQKEKKGKKNSQKRKKMMSWQKEKKYFNDGK